MPAEIFVPAFPQRSPPRLLPAAACGGLRSAPDHRTRRALLHLSYSCAPQTTRAALVTHDPLRTWVVGRQLALACLHEADLLKAKKIRPGGTPLACLPQKTM